MGCWLFVSTPSITGIVFGEVDASNPSIEVGNVSTPSITGIVFGGADLKEVNLELNVSQPPP